MKNIARCGIYDNIIFYEYAFDEFGYNIIWLVIEHRVGKYVSKRSKIQVPFFTIESCHAFFIVDAIKDTSYDF